MSTKSERVEVGDDTIIVTIKSVEGPFASAAELAEQLPISRQQLNDRLRDLKDRGILRRKRCGSGYGWWIPEHPAKADQES